MGAVAGMASTISRTLWVQDLGTLVADYLVSRPAEVSYKRLMDSILRGVLRKTYLLIFWSLVVVGVGGSSIAAGMAFAGSVGGHAGFCFGLHGNDSESADDKSLAEEALADEKRVECRNIFILRLIGSWLPFLGFLLVKNLLSWFLWLVGDRRSLDSRPPGC
jgi:hypothetical protein